MFLNRLFLCVKLCMFKCQWHTNHQLSYFLCWKKKGSSLFVYHHLNAYQVLYSISSKKHTNCLRKNWYHNLKSIHHNASRISHKSTEEYMVWVHHSQTITGTQKSIWFGCTIPKQLQVHNTTFFLKEVKNPNNSL